jgi:hypothetical protein
MKIKNISSKTFEFFKEKGKKIVCLVTTGFVLATPCKAKLEEYEDGIANAPKERIEEILEEEKIVFVVTSEWQKTPYYSDGKGAAKENREYQRTIRRITIDENYNEDYFNSDYRKILQVIEDGNFDKIFKVIDEKLETIVVDKEEEGKLEKTNWTLEVEGTDIKEKRINPDLLFNIKNNAAMILFFSIPLILMAINEGFEKVYKVIVKKKTK